MEELHCTGYFILRSYRTSSYRGLTEEIHRTDYFILRSYRTSSYCGLTEELHRTGYFILRSYRTSSYCGLTEELTVLTTSYYGLAELVPTAVLQKSSTVLTTSYCGLTELVHTAVLQKSSTVLTCSAVSIRVNPLVPAQQHGLAEGDRPARSPRSCPERRRSRPCSWSPSGPRPYLAAPAAHEEDGAGPEGQALHVSCSALPWSTLSSASVSST